MIWPVKVVNIVLCVLILIVGPVMYKNMMDTLDEKNDDMKDRLAELKRMNEDIASNQKYVEKWQKICGFMDETIQSRRTIFATYLDTWKQECGFDFSLLGVTSGQAIKGKHEYQELIYNRSFETDLSRVVEFLSLLDKSQKLLRIEHLEIRQNSAALDSYMPHTDRAGDLDVTLRISIPAAAMSDDSLEEEVSPWEK